MTEFLIRTAAGLSRRYQTSPVGRVLKLDPSKLKKLLIKRPARASARKKPQAAFFQLPTETALLGVGSSLLQIPNGCRLQNERTDGSRLTLRAISASISAGSVELGSGSFFIGCSKK
jgi:hypothetical protein